MKSLVPVKELKKRASTTLCPTIMNAFSRVASQTPPLGTQYFDAADSIMYGPSLGRRRERRRSVAWRRKRPTLVYTSLWQFHTVWKFQVAMSCVITTTIVAESLTSHTSIHEMAAMQLIYVYLLCEAESSLAEKIYQDSS